MSFSTNGVLFVRLTLAFSLAIHIVGHIGTQAPQILESGTKDSDQ